MTFDLDDTHTIGRYRQSQHTCIASPRSQGQVQGHEDHFCFWLFLRVFANSSYSFDRRVLKTHKYVLSDHTQKRNAAEF